MENDLREKRAKLLQAFSGTVPPIKAHLGYRFALLIVSVFMLLVPLLYIALPAGLVYLIYWHATEEFYDRYGPHLSSMTPEDLCDLD